MAEYIEREKLHKHFENNVTKNEVTVNGQKNLAYLCDHVLHEIRNAPTADVAEVVRCGQCKHATDDIIVEGVCYCHKIQQGMFLDGFCNYGERRNTK